MESTSIRDANPARPARKARSKYPFALRVAGCEVLWGDESSIAVIFNNVSGRNFECAANHADYLTRMGGEWEVDLSAGIEVALVKTGGAALQTGRIVLGASHCGECIACQPGPAGGKRWELPPLRVHGAQALATTANDVPA